MITNRPTIFMVANGDWIDGELTTQAFVRSQAESLRACDCEVFLTIVDDRTSIRGILKNVRRIRAEVRRAQPNLIHAQYGSVTAAVGRLASGSLPLIVSFCGSDLLGSPVSGILWRIREACSRPISFWTARRASTIIVKSRNLLHALPADLQDRAEVLPNGVDANTFQPMDRDECRGRLGWNKKSKIILFDACWNGERQGRNRKNPALAEATVDLVAKSIPDIHLFMMSNVPHKEIHLMMNAADCLLVTSLQEGSANIIKEAMACNLPVVSVPCGDVVERLSRTTPGGIRPYNAAALAQCVQTVISTGQRSNGREQLILQGLTTVKVAERLMQIYQQVEHLVSRKNPMTLQV